MMAFEKKEFPEGVLFAQLDQLITHCDYGASRPCMRFIGVDKNSFLTAAFNSASGCKTFLIDVDVQAGRISGPSDPIIFYAKTKLWQIFAELSKQFPAEKSSQWYEISYSESTSSDGGSYGYALFQNAAPTFLKIDAIKIANGDAINPINLGTDNGNVTIDCGEPAKTLKGFHVGQGMCSAVYAGEQVFLLDAGAGTPVKRPAYISQTHDYGGGRKFTNHLQPDILTATTSLILSHPDSDHWRLLDWDPLLMKAVRKIFVPHGTRNIIFSDATIKPYLTPTARLQVRGPDKMPFIDAIRSDPASPFNDSNGECLVSLVTINHRRALAPGDYSYAGMLADKNALISALLAHKYDAVIVPHHGDQLSAQSTPTPSVEGVSIAFFSAGDNLAYHHPRAESLNSHHQAGFKVRSKKWIDDVIKTTLL